MNLTKISLTGLFSLGILATSSILPEVAQASAFRIATFNASFSPGSQNQLIQDLSTDDNTQARQIAEVIQRTNPDILLINEFNFNSSDRNKAAQLFQENYLSIPQNISGDPSGSVNPVNFNYFYVSPASSPEPFNTGIASGFDLDNNGTVVTIPETPGYAGDAWGFGNFPGQYGMVIYSKYPILADQARTFQNFLWKDMPGALLPTDWYTPEELTEFPLSSKSHWDIPIDVNGEIIHVLTSHPTPPVFDGLEDRNGKRNHDEIRLWADYITPGQGDYIYDDNGVFGGLTPGSSFVIMGDQNADPNDGDSYGEAIQQLLNNPLVNTSFTPESLGGVEAAIVQGGPNNTHQGEPANDTGDFGDREGESGNLRVDYVLPSGDLTILDGQVFWPTTDSPLSSLNSASDHHLVVLEVVPEPLTLLGTGTAISFGAFFKGRFSQKKKKTADN